MPSELIQHDDIASVVQAFYSEQHNSRDPHAWYVPYRTAVLITLNTATAFIQMCDPGGHTTHVVIELNRDERSSLITDGIFDCGAFSLENDGIKLLFHAHGSASFESLFNICDSYLDLFALPTILSLSYNPRYLKNIIKYEWICFLLTLRNKNVIFKRHLINGKTRVKV